MLNVKPSRFGRCEELFDFYDHCAKHGIGCYGGGQTELGLGRGQIQYLASLFHPDGPERRRARRLQPRSAAAHGPAGSPLQPAPAPTGFRWED